MFNLVEIGVKRIVKRTNLRIKIQYYLKTFKDKASIGRNTNTYAVFPTG